MIMEMMSDDGFVFEIFSNQRLSEKDAAAVFLLTFFDIHCFLTVN